MLQQCQVMRLNSKGLNNEALWAYRYRVGGRDSKRVQRGGFRTERDAREALERELEVLRRGDGLAGQKLEARSRTRTDDPFLTMEVLYRLSYPGGPASL
jgi:hypothetical protein